jgi:hypothetical protein
MKQLTQPNLILSVEQSPQEADGLRAKYFVSILWNLKVWFNIHRRPSLVRFLSQTDPVQAERRHCMNQ